MSQIGKRVNPVNFRWVLDLPIGVKLALGLTIVLLITGYFVDTVARNVINDAQLDIVYSDLQSASRADAFSIVDLIGQEITVLNRVSGTTIIQSALDQRASAVPVTSVYQPAPGVQAELETLRATREELASVAVVNPNGVLLGIDPIPPSGLNNLNPEEWVWFDSALTNGGSVYLASLEDDFLTDYQTGEAVGVSIALPIYQTDNPDQLVGVIYAVWNLSNISAATDTVSGRQTTVLQPDGTVLVSQGRTTPGTRVAPDIRQNIQAGPSGAFQARLASGNEYLYGFVRLDDTGLSEDNPATDLRWIVMTRQPIEAATNSALLVLGRLRVALAAALGFSLLVILGLARLVTRPLIRLTDTATDLAAGELNTPIPQLPNDEVGQLADVLRDLVGRLLYRVQQLNAAVQVSRATATTFEIDQMLSLVSRQLTEQFSIPEIRIYLVGEEGNARLNTGLGPESERLARSSYSVRVDENSLPGRAMLTREEQYSGGFEAPAFAGSSMEPAQLALPLISSGDMYGAMHLIADRPGAFEQQDIDILRLIADQVASSLNNAHLFEQSRANLQEIETLNRRLTQQAWSEYLEDEERIRFTVDDDNNWPTAPDQTSELVQDREIVTATAYTDDNGRNVLVAPLLLRGEAIGVLAATRPPGSRFTQDEIGLLESITARMALIAEGIRLVEESNRRAAREQMISDVSARLFQQTDSVEAILQGALSELGAALGSEHLALRIGEPPAANQKLPPRTDDTEAHHETRSNGAHDEGSE